MECAQQRYRLMAPDVMLSVVESKSEEARDNRRAKNVSCRLRVPSACGVVCLGSGVLVLVLASGQRAAWPIRIASPIAVTDLSTSKLRSLGYYSGAAFNASHLAFTRYRGSMLRTSPTNVLAGESLNDRLT